LLNTDYDNIGGVNSHLLLNNASATGQTAVSVLINGQMTSKWRSDYTGNINWVSYATTSATGHNFMVGGDYSVGTVVAKITSSGVLIQPAGMIGNEVPSAALQVAGSIMASGPAILRNGLTATTLQITNTFTSSTSYELLNMKGKASANFEIGPENGSSGGTLRGLTLGGYSAGTTTIAPWLSFTSGGNASFPNPVNFAHADGVTSNGSYWIYTFGANAGFRNLRANGTSGSPTRVLSGDIVGFYSARGYHFGGAYHADHAGYWGFTAAEDFTATAQGTTFSLQTTTALSATPTQRMFIDSAGVTIFSGEVRVPTASPGTNTTQAASTAFVTAAGVGSLTPVTITDAAVAMTANRRYQGSIAAFTADRNYTLPAGTAGDVIEVQITTGDDLYELILLGATGVSINGGIAATEWSRLFISNEVVRFYCFATNDWRVVVDGRIPATAELVATSSALVFENAWTQVLFNTESSNSSSASHANDRLICRRAGTYNLSAYWLTLTSAVTTILALTRNGATVSPDRRFASTLFGATTSIIGNTGGGAYAIEGVSAAAGDTFEMIVYINGTTATAATTVPYQPRLAFTEVL
jgi:hypothetical protein